MHVSKKPRIKKNLELDVIDSIPDLVRNHVVHISESDLITIAGGKWTTYRAMAAETVDAAVEVSLNF